MACTLLSSLIQNCVNSISPIVFIMYEGVMAISDVISYNSINLIQKEKRVTENIIKLSEIIYFPKFSSYDKLVRG